MNAFNDRKDAFEKQFARDQELQFRAESRACKLFGLWVASKLGLDGPDAQTYAKEVIMSNLDEPGLDDVIRKAKSDTDAKGLDLSAHVLQVEMSRHLEEAKRQLMEES